MIRTLSLLFAASLLAAPARAEEDRGDPAIFLRGVKVLGDRSFYYEQIDPQELLCLAAERLEPEVPWLFVSRVDEGVRLAGPEDRELGVVSVGELDELGPALQQLRQLVDEAGLPLDPELRLDVELLRGMVGGVDKYTRIDVDRQTSKRETIRGVYSGIGIRTREKEGAYRITEVFPGGPAHDAGLYEGDVILAIDGVPTLGMSNSERSKRIRGQQGTRVDLTIRRGGSEMVIRCVRGPVRQNNGEVLRLDSGFAYVDLRRFDSQTSEWLSPGLFKRRQDGSLAEGVILDLRGNGGGTGRAALYLADQFLPRGLIVEHRNRVFAEDKFVSRKQRASDEGFDPQVPIVVLMDGGTASASEIVAGALRYNDRTVLVGSRTVGKASGWRDFHLWGDVSMQVTVQGLALQGGHSVAGVGLTPDVQLDRLELDQRGAEVWVADEPDALRLVLVDEDDEWREGDAPERPEDPGLAVAERILAESQGWKRKDLLKATERAVVALGAEQDAILTEAYAARDIDWSPAPAAAPPPVGLEIAVEGPVVFEAGGDSFFDLQLTNGGPHPAWRVQVDVEAEYGRWDRLIIPVGHVPAGETVSVRGGAYVGRGAERRVEEVRLVVTPQGFEAPVDVMARFEVQPSPRLELAVHGAVTPDGEGREVLLEIENLSDEPTPELTALVELPEPKNVAIGAAELELAPIPPGESAIVEAGLRIEPGYLGDNLPIRLDVKADGRPSARYRPLELPLDGQVVTAHPRVSMEAPGVAEAGEEQQLTLRVEDEGALKHVAVFLNEDKVAYAPGGQGLVELEVPLSYAVGANEIEVEAADEDGRWARRWLYVWGRGEPEEQATP